ncbi:MAG TPA: hypothetical protein VE109_06320 [Acidobacteriaceae bacterium]|nr:hypothetical protein [Acidobacteriaceae bacterium]
MNVARRFSVIAAIIVALLLGCFLGWFAMRRHASSQAGNSSGNVASLTPGSQTPSGDDLAPTLVYAHNIMLRKGPDFRIYIVWISGRMVRTKQNVNPSFDEPDSFILQIEKGVIHANIGDICKYLNSTAAQDTPLKNIDIQPEGELVKIRGTVKKVVPLPIEILGSLAATPDGLVRLHVQHISLLKVPVKGLLGTLDVKLSDLVHSTNVPGVTISGNVIVFDTEKLLPPPHIRGQLTTVRVKVPDIEVIYGSVPNDPTQLAQWHNFLRFRNGALNFGKLTMHHADLTMIDASHDAWFDLDLVNYQAQLVNGYTRMTAQAGLEIFMPDLDEQAMKKTTSNAVTLEWLKNRNSSLPADVAKKTKAQ